MIADMFALLSAIKVDGTGAGELKFNVNLNKNRIRSISAFSSNSIFYFPMIITNQVTPEEVGMLSRTIEKTYATFVVSCISLMPFHRVSSNDTAAIDDYLKQFHQNLGMVNPGNGAAMGKLMSASFMTESAGDDSEDLAKLGDHLLECWHKARKTDSDFISIVNETVPLNKMFSEDPLDPMTKLMKARFNEAQTELDTWGFIGDSIDDSMYQDDDIDDDDPEFAFINDMINEESTKVAIQSVTHIIDSVSLNKIKSAKNLTKLKAYEGKLTKLKTKYAKYLARYKHKYNENKKSGSSSKLSIKFNGMDIDDPKGFMTVYGKNIKIINKRLAAVEARRAELRKRKGLPAEKSSKMDETINILELDDMDIASVDVCLEAIDTLLNSKDDEIFTLTEAKTPDNDWINQYDDYHDTHDNRKAKALETQRNNAVAVSNVTIAQNRQLANQFDRTNKQLAAANSRANAANIRANDAQMKHIQDQEKFIDAEERELRRRRQNPATRDSDASYSQHQVNMGAAAAKGYSGHNTFDKEIFTKMDMTKANEAVPTYTKATIGFIVDETEDVVTRDVLIGIKTHVHKAPSMELTSDIYNCLINKRKFLKFIKFISGEEKSLADLVFGFKQLRSDAIDGKSGAGEWRSAFKRRKRWSKMSIPYLMKEYTPNGTIVITMDEVEYIRSQYGIDPISPQHIVMLMDINYLLGFVVIDQANEVVHVTYDGFKGNLQQYTYAMLEREQQNTDRMMRELYRASR